MRPTPQWYRLLPVPGLGILALVSISMRTPKSTWHFAHRIAQVLEAELRVHSRVDRDDEPAAAPHQLVDAEVVEVAAVAEIDVLRYPRRPDRTPRSADTHRPNRGPGLAHAPGFAGFCIHHPRRTLKTPSAGTRPPSTSDSPGSGWPAAPEIVRAWPRLIQPLRLRLEIIGSALIAAPDIRASTRRARSRISAIQRV